MSFSWELVTVLTIQSLSLLVNMNREEAISFAIEAIECHLQQQPREEEEPLSFDPSHWTILSKVKESMGEAHNFVWKVGMYIGI